MENNKNGASEINKSAESPSFDIYISGRGAKYDTPERAKIRRQSQSSTGNPVIVTPAKPLEVRQKAGRRKLRVAGYCRVSTDSEAQLSSIENQKAHFIKLAAQHDDWNFVGIFADEGISGTYLKKRKSFNKMLDLCRAGQIDYIVIKDVARYARNTVDSLQIARELRSLNPPVGIYFETLNFDTLRNDYEMLLGVMSMCCQLESQQKSEAMLWSLKHRFEEGHFLCPTNNLLGYITVDGVMTVEEEGAKTVSLIFYMYLAGYTAQEIADIMTEAKRKTGWTRRDINGNEVYNYKWSSGTVLNILRNERYCGNVHAQKTYTVSYLTHEKRKNNGEMPSYDQENHHEGIVTPVVYDTVQKIIDSNKYKTGSGKVQTVLSVIPKGLLRGFIPMNRLWTGSTLSEYIMVSDSASWDDVKPKSVKLPSGINGMEIMRTDYTENQSAPYITLTYSGINFNTQCRWLMKDIEYVELLLHPKEKLLAIRACTADNPNAVKWAEWTDGKCKMKTPGVGHIPKVIYDVMNWNIDWKFKASGEFRSRKNEGILVFSLEETAAYIPIMQADEYDEDHFIGWNKPIYPYEWREQIVGPTLLETITKCRMHLCDYFNMWDVSAEPVKVAVEGHERAVPKSREEILEELEKLNPEMI